jgi:hypothetical protein
MSSPATRLGRKSARPEPGTIHPEMSRQRRSNVGSCESLSAVCAAIHSCREPITCFDIGFLPSARSIVYPVQLYDERTVTCRTRCAESEPKACSVVGGAGERSGEPGAQMRGDGCYRSCLARQSIRDVSLPLDIIVLAKADALSTGQGGRSKFLLLRFQGEPSPNA